MFTLSIFKDAAVCIAVRMNGVWDETRTDRLGEAGKGEMLEQLVMVGARV